LTESGTCVCRPVYSILISSQGGHSRGTTLGTRDPP